MDDAASTRTGREGRGPPRGGRGLADPEARDIATELVQALLDLYGEGARAGRGATSPDAARRSPTTSSSRTCCCCTGCIPCPSRRGCAERSTRCVRISTPHGGNVELCRGRGRRRAAADGGQLQRLSLVGGDAEAGDRGRDPQGRARTSWTSRPRTPASAGGRAAPALIQLAAARTGAGRRRTASWATAGALPRAARDGTLLKDRSPASRCCSSASMGNTYAYRPECPACGHSLEEARAAGGGAPCPGCGHRYDAIRAGRCSTRRELHLDPMPLLVGRVRPGEGGAGGRR